MEVVVMMGWIGWAVLGLSAAWRAARKWLQANSWAKDLSKVIFREVCCTMRERHPNTWNDWFGLSPRLIQESKGSSTQARLRIDPKSAEGLPQSKVGG